MIDYSYKYAKDIKVGDIVVFGHGAVNNKTFDLILSVNVVDANALVPKYKFVVLRTTEGRSSIFSWDAFHNPNDCCVLI